MALSLTDAQRIGEGARAKAQELGINVVVVVVDDRGDLVLVERMDGARWFTATVAQGKAFGTAMFRRASSDLANLADTPFFRSMLHMQQGRVVFAPGAVPVLRNEALEGAVGISGGTGEQDEECAKAGAAAL